MIISRKKKGYFLDFFADMIVQRILLWIGQFMIRKASWNLKRWHLTCLLWKQTRCFIWYNTDTFSPVLLWIRSWKQIQISVVDVQDLRGLVVQQGGSKVLVQMALDGTDKGMRTAAQALSRIAITQARGDKSYILKRWRVGRGGRGALFHSVFRLTNNNQITKFNHSFNSLFI